jgi:hypothetical protein
VKYFLDTEFNGYEGALISLALIREDGVAKYWVIKDVIIDDLWVIDHVLPYLYYGPWELVENKNDLSREIARFLKKDESPEIHVDWLDDLKHFSDVMVFGPGQCRNIKNCKFVYDRSLGTAESKVPHNAFYDALAIWEKFNK